MRCSFACSLAIALLVTAPASADFATFNTSDSQFDAGLDNQGWWSDTFNNSDGNTNYTVGWRSLSGGQEFRNFFTFDLSSLTDIVVGATLEVVRYSYFSPDASETLGLFDVTTDAATLNNNVGTNAAIFNDLGSGTSYGTFVVNSYSFSSTELLSFSLNSNALADINAAKGGFFSIGGALQSLTKGIPTEFIETSSGGFGIQRLVVETQPIPLPSTIAMAGFGLLAFGRYGWRRIRRA